MFYDKHSKQQKYFAWRNACQGDLEQYQIRANKSEGKNEARLDLPNKCQMSQPGLLLTERVGLETQGAVVGSTEQLICAWRSSPSCFSEALNTSSMINVGKCSVPIPFSPVIVPCTSSENQQ